MLMDLAMWKMKSYDCNHQVRATYSFPYPNAASERILTLLTTESTEEYWSFGLNGRVSGEISIIYSFSENKYLQKLYLKHRDCYQRYLMISAAFGRKSPHESVHFFRESGCIFKRKIFYDFLWKLFCQERCFVVKVLAEELWENSVFLCIFFKESLSPLLQYLNS